MLDFYGMQLDDAETGRLSRSTNYQRCYLNLIRSPHNNLRISRILKSLSELGLEHLNAGFLLFVLSEQSEYAQLHVRGLKTSMDRWWANCLRNREEREWIARAIVSVRDDGVIFTTEDYVKALEARARTGSLGGLTAQTEEEEWSGIRDDATE